MEYSTSPRLTRLLGVLNTYEQILSSRLHKHLMFLMTLLTNVVRDCSACESDVGVVLMMNNHSIQETWSWTWSCSCQLYVELESLVARS